MRAHGALRLALVPIALLLIVCAASSFAAGTVIGSEAVAAAMEKDVSTPVHAVALTGPDAACRACHVAETANYAASGHADLACTECHTVGAGTSQCASVPTDIAAVCRECHSTSEGTWHICDGEREDDIARAPLTCVSTCHDPHGTAYPAMTSAPADALCLSCHDDVGVSE